MSNTNTIPVVWHEGSSNADGRSRYADATLLNETFDAVGGFTHHSTFRALPAEARGAVIVVHGGNEAGRETTVLTEADTLQWAIIIVICDDESVFDTRLLQSSKRKLWQQMPIPGKHDFCDRFLICGYPDDIHRELTKVQGIPRNLDWFFAGQVTHSRRHHCVHFLENIPRGVLVKTEGFYQGLPHDEYFRYMASCKVVPCPAGPVTPDTIRLAEALEAGCVPIADDKPGNRSEYPSNYWSYVLKQVPPFVILKEWSLLPDIMRHELAVWHAKSFELQVWWKNYKSSMQDWLRQDIEELRSRCE